MKTPDIKINNLHNITITIRISKLLKFRMRLGGLLFGFAGWVSGCNVKIIPIEEK